MIRVHLCMTIHRRKIFIPCFIFFSFVILLLGEPPAWARQADLLQAHAGAESKESPTKSDVSSSFTTLSGTTIIMFPPGDMYPYYIADQHRVGFCIQVLRYTATEIPAAGKSRIYLKTGANIGIARFHPSGHPDRGWQLSVQAGWDGQFDSDNSQDNIGWDGNYGFLLSMAPASGLAFKLGMLHTSSHVGDEYIERTGRKRIGYTRHEITGGVSWSMSEQWRLYSEAGWGYDLRNETLMAPGRLQAGLEFVDEKSLWQDILGWYIAVDTSTWEERDWRLDVSAQLGVLLPSADHRVKLGIEYYNGRVPIGEFFQFDETYIAFGAWMDL